MPIDERGYLRPTYDDVLEARIELAKELFGDDIDTANDSPLGKFIRLSVQDHADALEAQEAIYYSRFPHTATGQSLDRLMPFAAITRNPATRAEHEITFTGKPGYEIPVGFLVGTTTEEEFYLVNAVVLDDSGVGAGIVQCTEVGIVGNVRLGAITEIINPDASIDAIEHTDILTIAEDEESDEDLRERFDIAILGSGSGTAAAIRGAVMRVTSVKSCVVVENDTNSVDAEGRPPHSFEVYVHAPDTSDQAIAEAIFSKKALGIQTVGDQSKTVLDVSGQQKTIYFSHVKEIGLYVKVSIITDEDFEIDGEEQIKTALLTYVNSLNAGEEVIYNNIYKYLFKVPGVYDVPTLLLSTDGASYSVGNVEIGNQQVAVLSADNIEVTHDADI